MAKIDYADLKNEIATILSSVAALSTVAVTVDDDIRVDSFGASINIEMARRDAGAPAQSLSAGQRQRYYLMIVASVVCVGIERQAVVDQRDDIISEVELAIMRNRTLNDKVSTTILQGGELFLMRQSSAGSEGYFIAAGEVIMQLDAEITTN